MWKRVCIVGLLLSVTSCKPGVGSSCDKGEAKCLNKQAQLACEDGKYIETPCRGPNGCSIAPEGTRCDISANKAGDRCSKGDEGAAACADPKTLIVCRGGAYQPAPCRGPDGCQTKEGRANCDTSIAESGDACAESEKPKACSKDGSELLSCKGGEMKSELACRGPDGCKIADGKLNCDLTLAKLDDVCPAEMEGKHACSVDRKRILICKSQKFAPDSDCSKPGEGCLSEGSIRCGKPE
ncbi:MAG: hypothetical protein R3B13_08900 [Polyangiaceae bacterium]